MCKAATNMLADRWQYKKSVLLVPQWRDFLPPITVTIGSDNGPAQDLNGCAWLLKCVVDTVMAGKAVDRRSIAPDNITWERVTCIMDETETASCITCLALRDGIWHDGLQFSSGARDVRFSTVPGEMVQNRRAGSPSSINCHLWTARRTRTRRHSGASGTRARSPATV